MNSIKIPLLVMIALFLSIGGGLANAEIIEGKIQSLTCVLNNNFCPVDQNDPVLGFEKTFVIAGQNNSVHFIENVDRFILSRNVLQKVRVTGEKTPKYKFVTAEKIEVYQQGKWKEVWNLEEEKMHAEYNSDYGF